MRTKQIDVPEELLGLLQRSRLGRRASADQVRAALAIHLFLEGLISIGKAAELAGVPRVEFEWLLVEMGLPTVQYDLADYEHDLSGLVPAAAPLLAALRRRGFRVSAELVGQIEREEAAQGQA